MLRDLVWTEMKVRPQGDFGTGGSGIEEAGGTRAGRIEKKSDWGTA